MTKFWTNRLKQKCPEELGDRLLRSELNQPAGLKVLLAFLLFPVWNVQVTDISNSHLGPLLAMP